jgi:hypothetical protein
MRALFCESTLDINLILSKAEIDFIRKSKQSTLSLCAGCGEREFYLSRYSDLVETQIDYIDVVEPKQEQDIPTWMVTLSDRAYEDLALQGKCGTRYVAESKITVSLDPDDMPF